jgi:hypothetical protein
MLWFRVTVYGKPDEQAFGVNLVVDTGSQDSNKINWWGPNKDFRFDRLITAWVTRVNGGEYQGTMGVADAAGVKANNFTNLKQNNLQIRFEGDSVLIGLKRTDVSESTKLNLIASVGSEQSRNDDIPNARFATMDLSTARPVRGLREIDVTRNNFQFPSDYRPLAEGTPAPIVKKGRSK